MTIDHETISPLLHEYWGIDALRPMQAEAISAGIAQRDSVVIMPTGGGKSLCYQVPPLVENRMDVVISPLISLMKDQVDGLVATGYRAAGLHSGMTPQERQEVVRGIRARAYNLVFVSPEGLLGGGLVSALSEAGVTSFAIDEAHCISHWGHDFRPEYRQLATLRTIFPGASLHAFTATATPRVRDDIIVQLGLQEPTVLVGTPDRPNLTYRIVPRVSTAQQLVEIVGRHQNEAVIVYCMTRRETESLATTLSANGIKAEAYHAGLAPNRRQRTQDAFARETLDVVVATIAFGMGIDRSNVRCVVHATMPKSIEHYQQETGRAGRDGLEAECVLLYSAADVIRWKGLLARSHEEGESDPASLAAQLELLGHMQGFCGTLECRHRSLSRYFGHAYEKASCEACDVCLNEVDAMPDSTLIARKILACVARLEQRFGVGQIVQVLRGADTEQVRRCGHQELSTFGLLRDVPEKALTNLVYQCVDQHLLERTPGDRPVLQLTEAGVSVMKGNQSVQLVEPKVAKAKSSKTSSESWEGVDRELFELLRDERKVLALERGVPPYVVFGDDTLRELARRRPGSAETMRAIRGVGERKLAVFGPRFLAVISAHCTLHGVAQDVDVPAMAAPVRVRTVTVSRMKERARELFQNGASLETVMSATGRARSTVAGYLAECVEQGEIASISTWVSDAEGVRISAAADELGLGSARVLRPIFEALGGEVSYDSIRLVMALREAESTADASDWPRLHPNAGNS
jgi:ATP-dependent DNA helicase RecQ